MGKIQKVKQLITDPVYRWDTIAYRGDRTFPMKSF